MTPYFDKIIFITPRFVKWKSMTQYIWDPLPKKMIAPKIIIYYQTIVLAAETSPKTEFKLICNCHVKNNNLCLLTLAEGWRF